GAGPRPARGGRPRLERSAVFAESTVSAAGESRRSRRGWLPWGRASDPDSQQDENGSFHVAVLLGRRPYRELGAGRSIEGDEDREEVGDGEAQRGHGRAARGRRRGGVGADAAENAAEDHATHQQRRDLVSTLREAPPARHHAHGGGGESQRGAAD